MWKYLKKPFSRLIPEHVGNPFSLVARMLASGKRSAVFTLWLTGLGVILTPLDMLLKLRERRTIADSAKDSETPIVFVCGPARSGTTVTYQVLSHYLPIQYIRNLTTLFPRSPITATRLFGRFFRPVQNLDLDNYYGKTRGMLGPSEGNHIWNRWVAPDHTGFRTILSEEKAAELAAFFQTLLALEQQPLINKNNNLNVFADIVYQHLPNSFFLCLRRDPPFLAQSLLAAREEIRGSVTKGYGVENTADTQSPTTDPVVTVCQQVQYLDARANRMQSVIGADRFWIVDYEQFCQNPADLISRVFRDILQVEPDKELLATVPVLQSTNRVKNPEQMNSIVKTLHSLGVPFTSPLDNSIEPDSRSA